MLRPPFSLLMQHWANNPVGLVAMLGLAFACGLIQITGWDNYQRVATGQGVGVLADPQLLEERALAARQERNRGCGMIGLAKQFWKPMAGALAGLAIIGAAVDELRWNWFRD